MRTCNARQTDQAPFREHHEQCASRHNRDQLVHPGRDGAYDRVLARAALGVGNETTLNVRQVRRTRQEVGALSEHQHHGREDDRGRA